MRQVLSEWAPDAEGDFVRLTLSTGLVVTALKVSPIGPDDDCVMVWLSQNGRPEGARCDMPTVVPLAHIVLATLT